MNQRGSAYVLAMLCLLVVSSTAILWQKKLQAYPGTVIQAWSDVTAEQGALSGVEYALALRAAGNALLEPREIQIPGGTCNLTFTRANGKLVILAKARVRTLQGWKESSITYHAD